MIAYLIRRFFQLIVVLAVSSMVIFGLLFISPGGPLSDIIHRQSRFPIPPEDIVRLQRNFDLDLPLWQAYTRWLVGWPNVPNHPTRVGLLRGDFGESWRFSPGTPNREIILGRLPNTLKLMITATILSLLVAIPIGIYSAVRQYSTFDYIMTGLTFFGTAMPIFWIGLMMILLFSFYFRSLGWFYLPSGDVQAIRSYTEPFFGRVSGGSPFDQFLHIIMPVIALSLLYMAGWSRYTRSSMLEVLRQDYVRTARAKGLIERLVVMKHALRNALIPLVTIIAFQIPGLFSGAIITESVFNWPGMGRLYIDALYDSDWPLTLAILMITAALVVVSNLVADVLYTLVDPRITYS